MDFLVNFLGGAIGISGFYLLFNPKTFSELLGGGILGFMLGATAAHAMILMRIA